MRSPAAPRSGPAPVFTALGDETRLAIVSRICGEGPLSIAELTAGTGMSRQAVSKHLGVLQRAGVAEGRRRGREHIWRIRGESLDAANRYLAQISGQWDDALGRLRDMVETAGD